MVVVCAILCECQPEFVRKYMASILTYEQELLLQVQGHVEGLGAVLLSGK